MEGPGPDAAREPKSAALSAILDGPAVAPGTPRLVVNHNTVFGSQVIASGAMNPYGAVPSPSWAGSRVLGSTPSMLAGGQTTPATIASVLRDEQAGVGRDFGAASQLVFSPRGAAASRETSHPDGEACTGDGASVNLLPKEIRGDRAAQTESDAAQSAPSEDGLPQQAVQPSGAKAVQPSGAKASAAMDKATADKDNKPKKMKWSIGACLAACSTCSQVIRARQLPRRLPRAHT